MEDSKAIAITVIIVVPILGGIIFGIPKAEYDAGAVTDRDCVGWPPYRPGPNDEPPENPHGCHKVCVEGHFWYKFGKKTHCYYDDTVTEESS